MAVTLTADMWKLLVSRIGSGNCTPFVGAGASISQDPDGHRGLMTGATLAAKWARHRGQRHPSQPGDLPVRRPVSSKQYDPGSPTCPRGRLARFAST
jgi:hypothetical protein